MLAEALRKRPEARAPTRVGRLVEDLGDAFTRKPGHREMKIT
jgi:hypothetical protein